MSYLNMVNNQLRKRGWKILFRISIDHGKSLKLKDEIFPIRGELMRMIFFKIYCHEREFILSIIRVKLRLVV